MLLPYTENPPEFTTADDKAILDRILVRRGPSGLLAIDMTLLHAPPLADGFNAFFKALRTQNSLPADCREVAFCTVAAIIECWYEWDIHAPIASANGVSEQGLASIRALGPDPSEHLLPATKGLTETQALVMRYAAAVTNQNRVSEALSKEVADRFTAKEVVELTLSIAGFNCVARFVCALDIGERNTASQE